MKVLGATVDVKIASAESGGRYYVFEVTLPPGEGVPPHVHSMEDEVICVIEGQLEISIDGGSELAGPGTVRNFPIGVSHGFANTGNEPCRAIVYATPGTNFEQYFAELSQISEGPEIDMGEVVAISERFGLNFLLDGEG